jgi:hypothetical protein
MDSDYSKLVLWLTPLETAALIAILRKSEQSYLADYVLQQQEEAALVARKTVATA